MSQETVKKKENFLRQLGDGSEVCLLYAIESVSELEIPIEEYKRYQYTVRRQATRPGMLEQEIEHISKTLLSKTNQQLVFAWRRPNSAEELRKMLEAAKQLNLSAVAFTLEDHVVGLQPTNGTEWIEMEQNEQPKKRTVKEIFGKLYQGERANIGFFGIQTA